MSDTPKPLSRLEAERIIDTLPSLRHRLIMHQHYALMHEDRKNAKQAVDAVVKWLLEEVCQDKTTVRANYARKLAHQIAAGDYIPELEKNDNITKRAA